jgi:membrane protease YdiL (CAAX protease family)
VNAGTDSPVSPRAVRYLAGGFYLVLGGVGLLVSKARTCRWLPEAVEGGDPVTSLLYGLGFAAFVIVISGPLMRYLPWMRWLALEMRRLLGRPDGRTVLIVALASGIGEEVLFRGALQPAFGLVWTSLLFGLIHVGPDRRYLVWTAFAVAVGFSLGWIVVATGSLVGPIVAHVLINSVNLARIARLPLPEQAAEAESETHQTADCE